MVVNWFGKMEKSIGPVNCVLRIAKKVKFCGKIENVTLPSHANALPSSEIDDTPPMSLQETPAQLPEHGSLPVHDSMH